MSATPAKSVVVIGGTGGIGHAIAQFYADKGCDVVITGRDEARTNGIAKDIGGKTRGIAVDISEPESIAEKLASLGHDDHLALVAVDQPEQEPEHAEDSHERYERAEHERRGGQRPRPAARRAGMPPADARMGINYHRVGRSRPPPSAPMRNSSFIAEPPSRCGKPQ